MKNRIRNVSDTIFSSGPLKGGCKRGRKTASSLDVLFNVFFSEQNQSGNKERIFFRKCVCVHVRTADYASLLVQDNHLYYAASMVPRTFPLKHTTEILIYH